MSPWMSQARRRARAAEETRDADVAWETARREELSDRLSAHWLARLTSPVELRFSTLSRTDRVHTNGRLLAYHRPLPGEASALEGTSSFELIPGVAGELRSVGGEMHLVLKFQRGLHGSLTLDLPDENRVPVKTPKGETTAVKVTQTDEVTRAYYSRLFPHQPSRPIGEGAEVVGDVSPVVGPAESSLQQVVGQGGPVLGDVRDGEVRSDDVDPRSGGTAPLGTGDETRDDAVARPDRQRRFGAHVHALVQGLLNGEEIRLGIRDGEVTINSQPAVHQSSPSVGAPCGAGCGSSNPTDGEPLPAGGTPTPSAGSTPNTPRSQSETQEASA